MDFGFFPIQDADARIGQKFAVADLILEIQKNTGIGDEGGQGVAVMEIDVAAGQAASRRRYALSDAIDDCGSRGLILQHAVPHLVWKLEPQFE